MATHDASPLAGTVYVVEADGSGPVAMGNREYVALPWDERRFAFMTFETAVAKAAMLRSGR